MKFRDPHAFWEVYLHGHKAIQDFRAQVEALGLEFARERTGGTMKSIKGELKAAVSGYMRVEGYLSAAREDALNAIDAFFRDNLEEVEARDDARAKGHMVTAEASAFGDYRGLPRYTILRRKPEPEMKQVTRETLAVLKEFYEGTPQRTPEGDKAVAEVDRLLKGR